MSPRPDASLPPERLPAGFMADLRAVAGHPFAHYLAATVAAAVILFARAPRAYVVPQLFAEDGRWTGLLLTRGFWHTAFHGRPDGDYTILGNVLLLGAGQAWCALVHGGDPLELARSCALVAYAFVAAVVSLPVLLLRGRLPGPCLALVWLAACVMPLGIHDRTFSGFEILGRVCNAGFFCLYAAFVLVWHRTTAAPTAARLAAVDLGLFLCVATNPLCAAVIPAAAWPVVRDLWTRRRTAAALTVRGQSHPWPLSTVATAGNAEGFPGRRRPHPAADHVGHCLFTRSPAVVGLVILAAAVVGLGGLPDPWKAPPPERVAPLDPAGIVEITLARGALYPLLWPVYRRLDTAPVLAAAAGAVVAVACLAAPRRRMVYAGGGALLALTGAVLAACRPELRLHLHGYEGTFPDRYFVGQNLVALALAIAFAADVAERWESRRWLRHVPLAVVGAWIVAAALHEPPWRLAPSQALRPEGRLFAARAARAVAEGRFVDDRQRPDPAGAFVLVPNPEGTPKRFVLPRAALVRSLEARGVAVATLPGTARR